MVKEGYWEGKGGGDHLPITSYAVLEPKKSVVNCDGVIVDICFGALLKTGDFTLVKEEASEKLVIAKTVVIIYKVVTVIKMGKETSKTLTELAVNPFPTVVKEPIRGWTPLMKRYIN
jgi:hypothetical protein